MTNGLNVQHSVEHDCQDCFPAELWRAFKGSSFNSKTQLLQTPKPTSAPTFDDCWSRTAFEVEQSKVEKGSAQFKVIVSGPVWDENRAVQLHFKYRWYNMELTMGETEWIGWNIYQKSIIITRIYVIWNNLHDVIEKCNLE